MTEYKFVKGEHSVQTVVKRSRFIASAFGEANEDEAIAFIEKTKKTYPDATHHCYAYIADEVGNAARFSDDGEPSGTAGQPILQVLKTHALRKTVIVVTRYFGGVKLGAGGLLAAYTDAAVQCLKTAKIAFKYPAQRLTVLCGYPQFAAIESILRDTDCAVENVDYRGEVAVSVVVKAGGQKNIVENILQKTAGAAKIDEGEFLYLEI